MRRLTILLSLAAITVTGCGGGAKPKAVAIADPLREALAYMPPDAPAIAAVATDVEHGQGAAARNLLERFPGAELAVAKVRERIDAITGLPATGAVGSLLGNDLLVAESSSGPFAAWVVRDPGGLRVLLDDEVAQNALGKGPASGGYDTYTRTGTLIAVRGAVVVAGAPTPVREALARRAGSGGMTRALFTARLRGLPADALLRAEGNAQLADRALGLSLPYAAALNGFAFTVRADAKGLHARLHADTTTTSPDDLPIAPGAQAPTPLLRTNGATVGVRDVRHVIRFALRRLQASGRELKLLRRDVIGQLIGTATVWSPDLSVVTVSVPVADPGRVARALTGLRSLVGRTLAAAGLSAARYGVVGSTLVVTTNRVAPLAQLVAGRPGRINALPGAVAGVVRGAALRTALIRRFGLPSIAALALGALGDTTFSVDAEPGGIDAVADLAIN
jgi:hypothetical protein